MGDVPQIIGAAGLTGRQQILRVPDPEPNTVTDKGEPVYVPQAAKSIPSNCLRVLNSPLPPERGGGCSVDCPGKQRDGSCLADIVREANRQGVEWTFTLTPERELWWWDYSGPPLGTLPDPYAVAAVVSTHTFRCPHCQAQVEKQLGDWWCPGCGRNANDP